MFSPALFILRDVEGCRECRHLCCFLYTFWICFYLLLFLSWDVEGESVGTYVVLFYCQHFIIYYYYLFLLFEFRFLFINCYCLVLFSAYVVFVRCLLPFL